MKLSIYPLAFLLIFLVGCNGGEWTSESPIKFQEPQPKGVNPLKSFPKRFQGNYTDSANNYTINIGDNMIVKYTNWGFRTIKDSLVNNFIIKRDSLIAKDSSGSYKITIKGDSIINETVVKDTFFTLSDSAVIKKYSGYCFLNIRNGSSGWSVKKLSLSSGILTLATIKDSTELEYLKEVEENFSDTIPVNVHPSKKQFKHFIKAGGFGSEEKYYRVKR